MRLTTEMLDRFKGGQIEVQNENEEYIYRGEVKDVSVEDGVLRVVLAWMAKGEGYPPIPERWIKDERLDYSASLEIYAASNIGPSGGEVGGDDRLCLVSRIVGETVILFPPNGSKLDPAKVEELQLPA